MTIEKVFRKDLNAWRWKIDVTIDGRRYRRADFLKKQDAKDAIAALQAAATATRYGLTRPRPKIKLGDLLDLVKEDRALPGRQTLNIFTEFVEVVGKNLSLFDFTLADWKKYADRLKERDCQPNTINRYMTEVSSVLSSASKYFPDLAEWRPPPAPWLTIPPGRDRLLSKEEIAKILASLKSSRQPGERERGAKNRLIVHDLFRLMMLTGAREGEILNLKPNQISWDWKTVKIIATKTKTVRVIPLSDTALEIMRGRLPGLFDGMTKHKLYRVLQKIGESSGVAYGDRIENGWVIYDLRHLAATVMENAGIPYSAVSAILGHKRRDQTATYAHAQLETLRKAINTLESWCRDIDGFRATSTRFSPPPDTVQQKAFG